MNAEIERAAGAVFQAALDRPPDEREAFLASACGADAALRSRVAELLAADGGASRFLTPLRAVDATVASDSDAVGHLPGESIAGYQIVREIHRGGQGVVYQATHKTTKRKVAIKVMREGPFAGPSDRARFDREVQVLGQLEHPNIVAIHDTGVAAGCHYFVMDYVGGRTLDRWILDSGLGTPDASACATAVSAVADERDPIAKQCSQSGGTLRQSKIQNPKSKVADALHLFARICDAVNAAHLRGVIHRDLKPGNIRVDDAGEPHILDFGLAKVSTPDSSAMTHTGQFLGSLPWAAPEQAEGHPAKIDVRTDVYSLGVVLYQMLTGRFPYDVSGNMLEVLDRIVRATPARPSTVCRHVNDEVETIVLKCLQKERERRYQSAGELGRDVRRYLDGEPIEAKRDSFAYVLRKQLRRHLAATVVTAGVLALIVVAGVLLAVAWRTAITAGENEAAARRGEAQQAAIAAAVNDFVQDIFTAVDPAAAGAKQDIRVRDALDDAAERLDAGGLRDHPAVEAGVRRAVGRTYHALDLPVEAEKHLTRALALSEQVYGPDHLETALAVEQLALLIQDTGALESAEKLHLRALTTIQSAAGRTAAIEARCLNSLGSVLWMRGRLDDAEARLNAAAAAFARVAADDALAQRERASCLNNLAALAHVRGKHAQAEKEYRAALAQWQTLVDGPHPDVAKTLHNLAAVLSELGRSVEAEALSREALRMAQAVYPPDHHVLATMMAQLGRLLRELGRDAEAGDLLSASRAIFDRRPPQESPPRAVMRNEEGHLLWDQGRLAEAEAAFRESLLLYQGVAGVEKRDPAMVMNNLAGVLREQGRLDEAVPIAERALRLAEEPPAEDDLMVALVGNGTALVRQAAGRPADALPLSQRCVRIRQAQLAAGDWQIANARSVLGGILSDLGRFTDAEPHLIDGYGGLEHHPRVAERFKRAARQRLARMYEQWGRRDEAARWTAMDDRPNAAAPPPPVP